MKRFIITVFAAAGTLFAAVALTGAEGTSEGTHKTETPVQEFMQAPAVVTEECEGYILLMPCPVCHTCPVCQANCGTAHALRCCLGNKKPTTSSQDCAPKQQHIMTNKAEAVKHAAGRTPRTQVDEGEISILTIEAE